MSYVFIGFVLALQHGPFSRLFSHWLESVSRDGSARGDLSCEETCEELSTANNLGSCRRKVLCFKEAVKPQSSS